MNPKYVTIDRFKDVMKGLEQLTKSYVLFGIPLERSGRTGPINNAALGYIHENGAPGANIPARPFLVPGVQEARPKITEVFKRLAKRATDLRTGGTAEIHAALERIGLIAQSAVKRKITDGPFQPLAASTLAARRRKGRNREKPLIDTGQLRNAITYVVRSR